MAYRIEYGQHPDEPFYTELALVSAVDGSSFPLTGVEHQVQLFGSRLDYGEWERFGYVVASTSGGQIASPAPGVIAITIPASFFIGQTDPDTGVWSGCFDRHRQSIRFKLLAMPAYRPDFATADFSPDFSTIPPVIFSQSINTIATGTITLGDRGQPQPRVTRGFTPYHPTATDTGLLPATADATPNGPRIKLAVYARPVSIAALLQAAPAVAGGTLVGPAFGSDPTQTFD